MRRFSNRNLLWTLGLNNRIQPISSFDSRGFKASAARLNGRRINGATSSIKTANLYIEKADGSVHEIEEEDLFRYTRYRWMYVKNINSTFSLRVISLTTVFEIRFNESRELTARYLKFNLENLLDVAIKAVGNGATSCVKVLKCVEGLHNKAFLLSMNNGTDIIAKLPNPNAGPAHYTTASEVATRKYLRECLKLPVSHIYAWSSDRTNPVGAEYILEEKAPGRPLGELWRSWPRKWKLDIITQVVELEKTLASITFQQIGCIYFKDDLRNTATLSETLETDPSFSQSLRYELALGPLTTAELWKDGRSNMTIDRGPWDSNLEYIRAMGTNEIRWIEAHATPRMNYHRFMDEKETPDEVLALLKRYMDVSNYLVPPIIKDIQSKVLWHPDLHLDNIFVDPCSRKITRIVDWQSAAIAPLYLQCGVPKLFRHHEPVADDWAVPEKPKEYDRLSEEEKSKVDYDLESETCHRYYKYQTYKRNPRHWAALNQGHLSLLTKPVWLVSGVWQNRDVFFLRQSLIELFQNWGEIESTSCPCPITFTQEELKIHADEEENMSGVGQLLKTFRDEGLLPEDGMVDPEDYDQARKNCQKYKEIFLGLAESEKQKRLFSKIWPYQDSEL